MTTAVRLPTPMFTALAVMLTPMFVALALLLSPPARAQDAGCDAAARLKPLEWMVGKWTGELPSPDGKTMAATWTIHWVYDRKFLESEHRIGDGKMTTHGVYLWDPLKRTIRVWTVNSKGAWSQGVAEAREGTIRIQIEGIIPDGRPASSTTIFERTGADSMTLQLSELKIDGQPRPAGRTFTYRRK